VEINSKLLGISCIILAHVFFTTQDMTIKFINGDYALYQVMLIRSIVAMLFTLLIFVPIDGGFKYQISPYPATGPPSFKRIWYSDR